MDFLAAKWLWLLVVVAALVAAYVFVQVRGRRSYAVRFTNIELLDVVAPKRPGWRRHAAAVAFVLALVALVVSVARPTRDERVPRERATVVLAIDVSLSMDADDIEPNRLAAAQEAADAFLDSVPDTLNVGLVSFAGSATVVVAPTTDRQAVRTAIDRLELDEATAIGEAIFAGLAALATLPAPEDPDDIVPASIVVLSDGETTIGRSNESAIVAADEADVPVSTIAFGTEDGSIVIEGEVVPVPPNLAALGAIADATGGVAFEAESGGELEAAYEDIGSSIGYENVAKEIGRWFVAAAMLLLLAASAMSLAWFSRLP